MPAQQGIGGEIDHSVFVRHDGSVPLTAIWNAGASIGAASFSATSGGNLRLGNVVGDLRLVYDADEVARVLGVSNSEAEMLQKNATMTDLAGVGVRAVLADVNGKLSAP